MNKKLLGMIVSIVGVAGSSSAFADGGVCSTGCTDRYSQCSESSAAADGCLNAWHQCKVRCGAGGFTTIKAVVTPVAPIAAKGASPKTAALKSKTTLKTAR